VRPGASDTDLDRIEEQLGRLLPDEARQLYRWRNGGGITSIAPDLDFPSLELALKLRRSLDYAVTRGYRLPDLTNGPDKLDIAALFPVLHINKGFLHVLTTLGDRAPTSALYMLEAESDTLTKVAITIGDLIDELIQALQAGHISYTIHGVLWTRDPLSFDLAMEPYGSLPKNQA
jgi:hypothetical protein